ncbi:MAG: OmpH family outer membrane protein [Planctomycetes bacterium]|nr:OmpH family outer membrane protein [Planctomycetota bacterium]
MRKFWLAGMAAALLVAACSVISAGETPQAPEARRIGVVFIQQVFKNYNYARDMEERMKATYLPEQQRIEQEMARITEMERALQNNPLKPPGGNPWRKSMMEIEAARVELQSMQEEFATRVSQEEAALWLNMYNALQRSIKTIGDAYSYDLIIASPDIAISEEAVRSQNPMAFQNEIMMRRIQYVKDSANLTRVVTDLLNHRYRLNQQDPNANPL